MKEDGDFSRLKQTPLHVAVQRKNCGGLKVLLDELHQMPYNVEDIVNQRNRLFNDKVALHWAAHLDSVDTAILLVNNGTSLEIPDLDGQTPLHYAAERGSVNVLKFLIQQGACTTPQSSNSGITPLLYACWNGHVEVMASLLSSEQGFVEDII